MFSTIAVISSLIASLASASPKPTHPTKPTKPASPASSVSLAPKPNTPAPMVVLVQNPRSEPVVVYVENGWAQYRIGVVDANANKMLTVPSSLFGTNYNNSEVRFFVHGHNAVEDATPYIAAQPGAQIGLRVTKY